MLSGRLAFRTLNLLLDMPADLVDVFARRTSEINYIFEELTEKHKLHAPSYCCCMPDTGIVECKRLAAGT